MKWQRSKLNDQKTILNEQKGRLSDFTKGMNEDNAKEFLRVHKEYSQTQNDINDLQKEYNKNL